MTAIFWARVASGQRGNFVRRRPAMPREAAGQDALVRWAGAPECRGRHGWQRAALGGHGWPREAGVPSIHGQRRKLLLHFNGQDALVRWAGARVPRTPRMAESGPRRPWMAERGPAYRPSMAPAEKCSCIFAVPAIHGGEKKGSRLAPLKHAQALQAASVRNWSSRALPTGTHCRRCSGYSSAECR